MSRFGSAVETIETKPTGLAGQRVEEYPSSLSCWQGRAFAMDRAHRHDDLEVNLVSEAALTYLSGDSVVRIRPGEAALFWAAVPHRLIDCPDNWRARVRWLHIPLSTVLGWGLPSEAISRLLGGVPLLAPGVEYPDSAAFARWSADLAGGSGALREAALLEVEAGVRRLLRYARPTDDDTESAPAVRHVATMARFVADSYHRPITAADVAASAHLHPNYAMTLFRQVLGLTIRGYITQRRLAEAQRLLLTTDATTSRIAVETGFGSASRFYEIFTRRYGRPPGEYRRGAANTVPSRHQR